MQPTGHKAWKCIYAFHGRPRWYHIGDAAAIGLADARKLAANVMFEVARGLDPQAQRKAERSLGTFEDLASRYLEYSQRKNRSWRRPTPWCEGTWPGRSERCRALGDQARKPGGFVSVRSPLVRGSFRPRKRTRASMALPLSRVSPFSRREPAL